LNRLFLVLTIAYCGLIFWLSSSADAVPDARIIPGQDKAAHLVLYGGLAWLVSMGLRRGKKPVSSNVQFYVPVLFALFYGLTDEVHQIFVPERSCDPLDLLADGVGALIVQGILCRYVWGGLRSGRVNAPD